MKHAQGLVHTFHASHPRAPRLTNLRLLQAQQEHKEGILLRSVTTKGNHPRSHGHKGERQIGEEAYKILYPLGGHPTPSGCTGIDQSEEQIHQISPYMDKRASIKGAGEGAQTHRVLLGKRINPTPYLE